MPVIKSSKKRAKQTIVRTNRRKEFKTKMLTMVKNIIKWVQSGDTEKAKEHFDEAQKAIDTAAKKNIIHKKTAARKKSRIAKAINSYNKETA